MPLKHIKPAHADPVTADWIDRSPPASDQEAYPYNHDPLSIEEFGCVRQQARNEHGRTRSEQSQIEAIKLGANLGLIFGFAASVMLTIQAFTCGFT